MVWFEKVKLFLWEVEKNPKSRIKDKDGRKTWGFGKVLWLPKRWFAENLTKACGQKASVVTVLEYSDCVGMKWSLFPAFVLRIVRLKRPEQAKWTWGRTSRSGRKGTTLAVGFIRLMSAASGVSDRFRWGTNRIRERKSERSECAGWTGKTEEIGLRTVQNHLNKRGSVVLFEKN